MPRKSRSMINTLKLPDIKVKDKEQLIAARKRMSRERMAKGRPQLGPSFDILTPIEEGSREDESEDSRRNTQAESPETEPPIRKGSSEAHPEESRRTLSVEQVEILAPIQEETREEEEEAAVKAKSKTVVSQKAPQLKPKPKKMKVKKVLPKSDDDESSESEKSLYGSEDEETSDSSSEEDSEELSNDSEDEYDTDYGTSDDGSEDKESEEDESESDETEEEEVGELEEEVEERREEKKYDLGPPLRGQELLDHIRELVRAGHKDPKKNKIIEMMKQPGPILFDLSCRDPECCCKPRHKFAELQKTNVYRVLKLKKCYSKLPNMSIEEFMTATLPGMKLKPSDELITRNLLSDMIDHETFIHTIGNHYYSHRNLRVTRDRSIVEAILYLVLLRLRDKAYETVLKTVCELGALTGYDIVKYITFPDIESSIRFNAHKFYGYEFVKKLMKPLHPEKGVIMKFLRDIEKNLNSRKPKPTVPKEMKILERSRKPSAFQQEENQPEEQVFDYKPIAAKPVPKSTHEPPTTQRKLGELKLQNKSEALKLLQEAQKLAFKCAVPKPLPKVKEPPSVHKIRAAPVPDFSKPPPVKKTTATVLREAARYMQNDMKATELLKHLESGGASLEMYTLLQGEIRKRREEEELEAVERKHLQGLLTREEARLARQALLKERKERMKQFMLEHQEWERQLDELRAREEEKILAMKSKSQCIEQGARDRQQELQQKKHEQAQEMIRETRALLDQNIKEREAELAQRMEMIREMRALHELKCLQNKEKEVDFTEPPGLGLMGEMSLAELRERLLLMRMELQEEENERRARIQEKKERMRSLVQNTEEYIQNIYNQKELLKKQKKKVSTAGEKRLESPALQKLREKIEDARQQRIALAAATS